MKQERRSGNEEKARLRKEIKDQKHLLYQSEKSIIDLYEMLELARVNEVRLRIELLESMTTKEYMGVNTVQEMDIDKTADSLARIKDREEQIKTKEEALKKKPED